MSVLMQAQGPAPKKKNATFKAIEAAIKQSERATKVANAVTNNAVGAALVQVGKDALAPFTTAPKAHRGAVGYVEQGLKGVLGLLSVPAAALDSGLAMATADIAAMFPAVAAATLGMPHLGIPHGHLHPPSFVPPAPVVPLPSVGTVLASGALSVLINNVPAARVGDVGLAISCGTLAPPFEIMLGSSNVFIGGARAARMGDVTRVCNPMSPKAFGAVMAVAGMTAGALGVATQLMDAENSLSRAEEPSDTVEAASKAVAAAAEAAGQALSATMGAAQVAADAVALAMKLLIGKDVGIPPGLGNIMLGHIGRVHIGGFPCPDLSNTVKGLFKIVTGLRRKSKKAKSADGDAETCGCRTCTGGG